MTVPAQEYAALTSTLLLVDDIDDGLLIAETDGKMTGANIVDDPDLVEGLNLWSAVLRFGRLQASAGLAFESHFLCVLSYSDLMGVLSP